MSIEESEPPARFADYEALLAYLTAERLGSYMAARNNDATRAFALYEWNMRAAASVMELTSMIEVVVRNALDAALRCWAQNKHPGDSWLDVVPLDAQGRRDVQKARERASHHGKRPEIHGRVIAELSLGFWRFLVESRYLTSLWVPATHAAFPNGPSDLRDRQRQVRFHLQQLHFVRNRAAHHEPIHQRDLTKDFVAAIELALWISPTPANWVRLKATLPSILAQRPK